VRELVRDQSLALRARRLILARAEEEVVAHGEGARAERGRRAGGAFTGVHTHRAEVVAEARLESRAERLGQR